MLERVNFLSPQHTLPGVWQPGEVLAAMPAVVVVGDWSCNEGNSEAELGCCPV